LPSNLISVRHAVIFGASCGVAGVSLLAVGCNGLAAGLAFANILIYTLAYTPLKRVHPFNTHVGSIVGAIPPMIGWAALTGGSHNRQIDLILLPGGLDPGAWALAALLFVWQFPHFYSLSWGLRHDYGGAGYKMLANISPEKLPTANLRWSIVT